MRTSLQTTLSAEMIRQAPLLVFISFFIAVKQEDHKIWLLYHSIYTHWAVSSL